MQLKKYTYRKRIANYTLVKMTDNKFAIVMGNDDGIMSLKSEDQLNYYVKYISVEENSTNKDIIGLIGKTINYIEENNGHEWYDYMCHYTEIEYTTNIKYIEE